MIKKAEKTTKGTLNSSTKSVSGMSTKEYYSMVAKKAYELYAKRGSGHGNDKRDWYEAEKFVNLNLKNR